jgi:hypothetical protein
VKVDDLKMMCLEDIVEGFATAKTKRDLKPVSRL